MKTIIILSIVAMAVAAPLEGETMVTKEVVPIVRSTQDFETDGSYKFSFETADGYIREETGSIVNPGKEDAYVATVGLYRFKNPEGEDVEVRYTADTKGFVARGSHIPEVPVVPAVSDVPVVTADTVVPAVPLMPEVLVVPDVPVVPAVPVMPDVPADTVVPAVPVMPDVPAVTVDPVLPKVFVVPTVDVAKIPFAETS